MEAVMKGKEIPAAANAAFAFYMPSWYSNRQTYEKLELNTTRLE